MHCPGNFEVGWHMAFVITLSHVYYVCAMVLMSHKIYRRWVPAMNRAVVELQESIEKEIQTHFETFEKLVVQVMKLRINNNEAMYVSPYNI